MTDARTYAVVVVGEVRSGAAVAHALARNGHCVSLVPRQVMPGVWTDLERDGVAIVFPANEPAACEVVVLVGERYDDVRYAVRERANLLDGRIVLDLSRLASAEHDMPEPSFLEHIEARAPSARIVAACGARDWYDLVRAPAGDLVFACGADPAAKRVAVALLEALGLATEDVGGRRAARLLRALASFGEPGSRTRMHHPAAHDAEVFPIPPGTFLASPSDSDRLLESRIEVAVRHEVDVGTRGPVSVLKLTIGEHSVVLRSTDLVEPALDYELARLVRALERDELPSRIEVDDEGRRLSIGARQTSIPGLVWLTIGNLHDTHFEALVQSDNLVRALTTATRMLAEPRRL